MDKLNIRIEAARLAVESGADKETFDEMAKVIEKYIIGTLDLSEYDNPNATMEKAMDLTKNCRSVYEKIETVMKKKKLPIWEKRMKYGYNDNSFSWIWIYLLTLIFNRTWK